MIIYRATCPQGRVYIGITTRTLESRRRQHELACEQGSELKFHCALRKYRTTMRWDVIDTARSTEELREKERHWIALLNSRAEGYNSTDGGEAFCHVKDEYRNEDGALVTVYAASEAGRNEGRNAKIETPGRYGASPPESAEESAVRKQDRRIEQRNERQFHRQLRKQPFTPEERKAVREKCREEKGTSKKEKKRSNVWHRDRA